MEAQPELPSVRMQVPRRRSEQHRKYQRPSDVDAFLSVGAIAGLKTELERLEKERPKAADDVARYKEMGDLSENAAYTEAKFHLRRLNGRIDSIKERLKRAIVMPEGTDASGTVRVGATVTIRSDRGEKTYQVVGSQEADPSRGRISHLSPLGQLLMNKKVGDTVRREIDGKDVAYDIVLVT